MSISSHAKFSALSPALVTMCLLLGGLSPAYGQAAVQQAPSLTQQTSSGHTVSSTARKSAARTARANHHHTSRTRAVARTHARPWGPSQKVNAVLKADRRLTGSRARPAEYGGVVLYGNVFDDQDRTLAQQTASHVHGLKYVVNDLKTTTGQWMDEQSGSTLPCFRSPRYEGSPHT
jgi:osmotically-inducible protein OsmY